MKNDSTNSNEVLKQLVTFRVADESDLQCIVELLADDQLGASREQLGPRLSKEYVAAFAEIKSDPNNEIIVATQTDKIVGCFQLTFIPNLSHQGARRATIEGVRIASEQRSQGLGTVMIEWAIERCRSKNCKMIQLTTDMQRQNAISFYERLGFRHSHAGMKLWLD